MKPCIALVTPALAAANNGNWQTASRWARLLSGHYRVRLLAAWDGGPDDALIALHARRSAASIAAWAQQRAGHPLVVAMTGTDLYRDILTDAQARQSLALADRLIVLHEGAVDDLPQQHRAKARVCFQSCSARAMLPHTDQHLRALMVGHLREEKDPRTYYAAARQLAHRTDIRLDHIGGPLDAALAAEAQSLMREQPRYRWLGSRDHEATRRAIQRAHVLVHASVMEGGAHVVMEAMRSGTPVIASRISGNVGLLGRGHAGLFPVGDASALAALLERARDDDDMLPRLRAQGEARAHLFEPARERATLLAVLSELL